MIKRTIALLALSLVLAGCTLIPAYERPQAPVSVEWPMGVEPAHDNVGGALPPVASIAWEQFFQSPELREVIATALEHNRDLRVATLNVEAVRETYRIERANLLPSINGEVQGVRQKISQNIPFSVGNTSYINQYFTAQVTASWGVDFFGRIRSMQRSALEEFFASEEARRAVQVSLISEVANAYLQWLADREILALTQKTLDAQTRSFDLVNMRFEKGVADKLELSQARIPLEVARVNHALYTRLVQQDLNALTVLIGQPKVDELVKAQPLEAIQVMDVLPTGLPSEVLLLRPDVRQAEHELLAANADIGAARAAFFPSIQLTGGIGESSRELSNLFTSAAGSIWSFSPTVSVPIFQGGSLLANLGVSKTQRDIAVANYEKAIQQAFREVADELATRATLDEQIDAQADLVQAATDAYDTSQARYDQGVDSFLFVLDAQRSQYEAQQQLIELQKQRLANKVNLYKVLGGGQLSPNERLLESDIGLVPAMMHTEKAESSDS